MTDIPKPQEIEEEASQLVATAAELVRVALGLQRAAHHTPRTRAITYKLYHDLSIHRLMDRLGPLKPRSEHFEYNEHSRSVKFWANRRG